jgi:sugar/nucleoside kinase (ribokinase family)
LRKKTEEKSDCVVAGDAMFDITVLGLKSIVPRGTAYCDGIRIHPGGAGNVAVGIATCGGAATFIGKIGSDYFGRMYKEDLENHGVKAFLVYDEQQPTGTIVVHVDGEGDRSFIIHRGANDSLSPPDIENLRHIISNAHYVYICGYSIVEAPQSDAIRRVVQLAKKDNVKVAFDPGSYNIIVDKRSQIDKLVLFSDVLFPNYDEAKALVGNLPLDEMVRELGKLAPLVFLKVGADGCVVIQGSTYTIIGVPSVKQIDTTGAGDAFASAAIYGLIRGYNNEVIGKFANWFASKNAELVGPRYIPDKGEVMKILSTIQV